jgi:hypothetical protein
MQGVLRRSGERTGEAGTALLQDGAAFAVELGHTACCRV